MDLKAQLNPVPHELAIVGMDGKETGLFITVVYVGDDDYQRRDYERNQAMSGEIVSYNQAKMRVIDEAACSCVGWRWEGEANWGGEKPEFNTANLREVLSNNEVRSQITAARRKRELFTPA